METKTFTLLELLGAREWLLSVMASTRNFIRADISKEQMAGANKRLKEIDQELINRLMEDHEPHRKVFQDENFEETLQHLSKREE